MSLSVQQFLADETSVVLAWEVALLPYDGKTRQNASSYLPCCGWKFGNEEICCGEKSISGCRFPFGFATRETLKTSPRWSNAAHESKSFTFFQSRPILPKLANHSEKNSLLEAEVMYFIFSIIMVRGTFSQMLRDFVLSVNVLKCERPLFYRLP